jgi:hypothetical protein
MNEATKHAHTVAQNPWVNLVATVATVASFAWLLYDKAQAPGAARSWTPIILFTIGLGVFAGFNFFSFRVKKALQDSTRIPHHLHRINHLYRESLSRVCGSFNASPVDEDGLKQEQTMTLTQVCEHIAEIFERLTSKECHVAIKLLQKDADGLYCETYTRNGGKNERDDVPPKRFRVLTGENTGFDRALLVTAGTKPSHFWSPDLTPGVEKDYQNQRQKFWEAYKSTIVVPIRYVIPSRKGQKDGTDDIGFLCVDTLSRHRLNDGSHVEMLASFADQMYNYISIMRRSYKLLAQGAKA